MTLQGVPVVQGVAKDIQKSAMQAEMRQERQARLNDNHDGSHGIQDFALGSIASLRSRQGAFGGPGLSIPLSDLEMPALPASHSFTDFSMLTPLSDLEMPALPASYSFMGFGDGIYGWGYATESPISQDDQAALHATIVWRLRRPPGVIVAPVNSVRAATGSRRSAQSAQASAGSATVSGQQTLDVEGVNGSQSASPNAANASAPATGQAAVASNDHVLMIQSSAESDDRMCYYPEDRGPCLPWARLLTQLLLMKILQGQHFMTFLLHHCITGHTKQWWMTGMRERDRLLKLKLLCKMTMVCGTALVTLYDCQDCCLLIFEIRRSVALVSDDV